MACLKEKKYEVKQNSKSIRLTLRLSSEDYTVAEQWAELYAGGNISLWIRAAMKNYRPKQSELDLEK